jgi:hypothetical protein
MKRFSLNNPQAAIVLVVVAVAALGLVGGIVFLAGQRANGAIIRPDPTPTPGAVSRGTPGAPSSSWLYLPLLLQASALPTGTPAPPETPEPTGTPGPTETPRPTPTPRWPPPLEAPGRSRLGIHVIWNTSPDIVEFVYRTKPTVVKAVDDLGWLERVKELSPKTVTIARLSLPAQTVAGDPVAAAQAFVAQYLPTFLERPYVDYWEGWNEPDTSHMAWYAAFEAERVRVMASYGLKASIGNFAAGTPEWDQFLAFLPAIQAAQQYGGILGVHEYDAPTLNRSVGIPLPGRPAYPDRGVLALRYRYWYEDILKPRGLVIPLVISEAGIDGGIQNRPGPAEARGWRDFATYWGESGLSHDATRFYLEQLAWYDGEVQKDDYVLGFTVFTAGPLSKEWESFDVTQILPKIAYYMVSQRP